MQRATSGSPRRGTALSTTRTAAARIVARAAAGVEKQLAVLEEVEAKHRLQIKHHWERSLCAGVGSWRNPQTLLDLLPYEGSEERRSSTGRSRCG